MIEEFIATLFLLTLYIYIAFNFPLSNTGSIPTGKDPFRITRSQVSFFSFLFNLKILTVMFSSRMEKSWPTCARCAEPIRSTKLAGNEKRFIFYLHNAIRSPSFRFFSFLYLVIHRLFVKGLKRGKRLSVCARAHGPVDIGFDSVMHTTRSPSNPNLVVQKTYLSELMRRIRFQFFFLSGREVDERCEEGQRAEWNDNGGIYLNELGSWV